MAIPVEPGIGKTRIVSRAIQARYGDGEPIRVLHQGQRSCVPHQQAGYM